MNQAYAQWDPIAALSGGSFWIGRRIYRKYEIHISDYTYWNQTATGLGFDNVGIGGLKYSYVFSRKDDEHQRSYVNRHDFNIGEIPTGSEGKLEVSLTYIDKPGSSNTHSGWVMKARHQQDIFFGVVNMLALQYGAGPGTAFGYNGDPTMDASNKSWRVVELLDWQVTGRFSGEFEWLYQQDVRSNGDNLNWLSIGVRPVYALFDRFKLVGEFGRDQVVAPEGNRTLTKLTVAPTWSPNGSDFWTRPEVRLYYTYATWNKAAQRAARQFDAGSALSDTGVFENALHGSNIGLQVEYWW